MRNIHRENGYHETFINKYTIPEVRIAEVQTVDNKSLFMYLQFRGYAAIEIVIRILLTTIKNSGPQKTTHSMVTPEVKSQITYNDNLILYLSIRLL